MYFAFQFVFDRNYFCINTG